MNYFLPDIRDKAYFTQFLYLLLLALLSYTLFSLLQMLILMLMGYDVKGIEQLLDNADAQQVPLLKVMQLISTIGVFIAPALIFSHLKTGAFTGFLPLKLPLQSRAIWLTVLVTVCALPLMGWFMELNQGLKLPSFLSGVEQWMRETETKAEKLTYLFLAMHSPLDLLVNIIIIALFPALAEELLFRGCLQQLLIAWTQKPHIAIFLSAAIFSAFHLQFLGFVPRMLIGAFLGYLFYWSGNLWYAIIGHFVNNALQVTAYYFTQSAGATATGNDLKIAESLPFSSVLIGTTLFAGSLWLFYHFFEQQRQQHQQTAPIVAAQAATIINDDSESQEPN